MVWSPESHVTRYPESCGPKFHNVKKDHKKLKKLKIYSKFVYANAIKNASQSEIRNVKPSC